ncbi:MAG: thioredoxin domain-containing protein [Gammaproteobacteria bacterium]|nr:thioredoxin domain-containing protein [Gammaproteobacteria bacterium]
MNTIFDTSVENFDKDVIQASFQYPILVDLWADWCSPCIVIAPLLKKVIENYATEIALAKLEVDEGKNMKIAGQYQVRGFPTILFIQDGKEKARFSGAQSVSFIENFIDENIA